MLLIDGKDGGIVEVGGSKSPPSVCLKYERLKGEIEARIPMRCQVDIKESPFLSGFPDWGSGRLGVYYSIVISVWPFGKRPFTWKTPLNDADLEFLGTDDYAREIIESYRKSHDAYYDEEKGVRRW